MTYYLGIDLAARYSGVSLLNESSLEWYSTIDAGPESCGFKEISYNICTFLVDSISELDITTDSLVVYIEDLSHMMVKPGLILRIQGAVRYALHTKFPDLDIRMIMASTWLSFYGWSKTPGTTSKGFSTFACKALGYEFDKSVKGKQATDLHDSVLIARYGYEKANS